MPSVFDKDPQAKKPYRWPWEGVIGSGDPIDSYSFQEDSGDLILSDFTVSGTDTICWISGGTSGTAYRVTGHIQTASGLIDERSLVLNVIDL